MLLQIFYIKNENENEIEKFKLKEKPWLAVVGNVFLGSIL